MIGIGIRGLALTRIANAIKALFAAGEIGAWYDPSDLTTMFQDAAGTTPVTAVEQPVGLLLDKSKGLVLGAELVTNGDFSNGTTGWSVSGAGALLTESGGVATVANGDGEASLTLPNVAASKWYVISANVSNNVVTTSIYFVPPSGGTPSNIPKATAGVLQGVFWSGSGGSPRIAVGTSVGGAAYSIDNISVRELPGNHATQTTATKRPILKLIAGKYSLLFDGIDDALVTGSIDFTATDKMTVVAGVRKLSDAASGAVIEFSTQYTANPGTFSLFAPQTAIPVFQFNSGGTLYSSPIVHESAAPITAVIACTSSISGDIATLRKNGVSVSTSVADQGTGNFGNYPLYIGSRGGTSFPFNGHLYSLIVRGAQSTDAQIVAAETWVNGKTGAY